MEADFRLSTRFYLGESLRKIRAVWQRLPERDIWRRPNEECLAPANQLIHLSGNLRQWVLATLGGEPDLRARDEEFAVRSGPTKAAILADFEAVMTRVFAVLDQPIHPGRALLIQGHRTTPVGVWVHVTEHLSYHTGQLVFFAKSLHPEPFDFYGDWDLNANSVAAETSPRPTAVSLDEQFSAFVALLRGGRYLESIDRFYAEDIVQYENEDPPTQGKTNLLAAERAAEKRVASAEIKVFDAVVDEARGLVWGEMDIHFVSKEGVEQQLREAFRQNWRNGKIIQQRFYYKGFETVERVGSA